MKQKYIVLDRDGVINQDSDAYIKSVDEWIPIPGSLEAIANLNRAGYWVGIASNQSGIGRGYFTENDLTQMHQKMADLLAEHGGHIDAIAICPHTPRDNCQCRKPKTGLLEQLQEKAGVSLAGSYLVGDSLRDLEAGIAFGMKPVLVRTGKGEKTANAALPDGVDIYSDLDAAIRILQ